MNLFYDQTASLIRRIYDRRLTGPPVLELEPHFPAGERFAEAWRTIRDEAMAVAALGRGAALPRDHAGADRDLRQ